MVTTLVNPTTALLTDAQLEAAIRSCQETQKRNPPASQAWQTASDALAGLFHEARVRNLQITRPL